MRNFFLKLHMKFSKHCETKNFVKWLKQIKSEYLSETFKQMKSMLEKRWNKIEKVLLKTENKVGESSMLQFQQK